MSTDEKKLSKDDATLPDGDMKSRRELLAATAKLSALIGAMGLAGAGLTGKAAAETKTTGIHKTGDITLKRGVVGARLSPAVRKRKLTAVLQESLRTGNPKAALKRHSDLKLSRRQEAALMRISRREWAALRSAQSKMAAFKDKAAGDTGVIFW